MQRNFKNLVTTSVMILSVVHTSFSYAGGKGGGPGAGSGSGPKSFSVNSNHNFQSLSSNSLKSMPAFNTFKSNVAVNNNLNHLNTNSLHQVQIHNNGIQPLVGKTQIGKTPVNLNVGKNLQNLHVNQNTLKLNQNSLHLSQKGLKLNTINTIHSNNLLIGNKGLLVPKGPLFGSKFVSPFC